MPFKKLIGLNEAKEIDSKTDLQQEESLSAEHRSFDRAHHHKKYQQSQQHTADDSLSIGSSGAWPLSKPEVSQIKALNVKCEKNHMRVHIEFDRPFYGMIFSKGMKTENSIIFEIVSVLEWLITICQPLHFQI